MTPCVHNLGLAATRITLLLVVLLSVNCSDSRKPESRLQAKIIEYLKAAEEEWGFSGSVLVAHGDEVILRGGWGKADMDENQDNAPVTKFLIASITKLFTAVAVMQLVERGAIGLDSSLTTYLPDYPSVTGDQITLRHLLSHTSGLPDYRAIPDFQKNVQVAKKPRDVIDLFKVCPLVFEPGKQQKYSSPGYMLLGSIIEAVCGQGYESFVRENIIEPAGMENTGVFRNYFLRSDFAVGYTLSTDRTPIRAELLNFNVAYSVGHLASTVEDLFRFGRSLENGILITQSTLAEMLVPHGREYGLGFSIREKSGHTVYGHGGGAPGYTAELQCWQEDSLCIVVLCNHDWIPARTIADGVAAIALGE